MRQGRALFSRDSSLRWNDEGGWAASYSFAAAFFAAGFLPAGFLAGAFLAAFGAAALRTGFLPLAGPFAARAASSSKRSYDAATAKYDFRVFLLHLGLIGPEFKTARLHLLKRLGGSAAWKGERRDRRSATPATQAGGETSAEGAQAAA